MRIEYAPVAQFLLVRPDDLDVLIDLQLQHDVPQGRQHVLRQGQSLDIAMHMLAKPCDDVQHPHEERRPIGITPLALTQRVEPFAIQAPQQVRVMSLTDQALADQPDRFPEVLAVRHDELHLLGLDPAEINFGQAPLDWEFLQLAGQMTAATGWAADDIASGAMWAGWEMGGLFHGGLGVGHDLRTMTLSGPVVPLNRRKYFADLCMLCTFCSCGQKLLTLRRYVGFWHGS